MQRGSSFFRRIDKPLLIFYSLFLLLGWVCIYEASYVETQTSMFDIDYRSGMQLIWIIISIIAALVILNIKPLYFYTWAYWIYGMIILLLILTIFIAPNIKGSHSWIVIGSLSIQPAEFAKFATALALAYFYASNSLSNTSNTNRNIYVAILLIVLPMLIILLQKETGSSLVFLALIIMLYREGLSPYVVLVSFLSILLFVLTIRFSGDVEIFYTNHFGKFLSINIILVIATFIYDLYCKHNAKIKAVHILSIMIVIYGCFMLLNRFVFSIDMLYVSIFIAVAFVIFLFVLYVKHFKKPYFLLVLFVMFFIAYSFSSELIFEKVLEPHQRVRIEILLGLKEDPKGAEWNINQSKIAISSGRFFGKGFLKGTQTKLKFVPEQDTDFVFCTIAEEWGFMGSSVVVLLFFAFIYRIFFLSEKQTNIFARVYGYCVASIFTFHVVVNIGMVMGIFPVIGIPLPFFSYGGSSLLAFTILLFVFIGIDMGSKVNM